MRVDILSVDTAVEMFMHPRNCAGYVDDEEE